MTDRGNLFDRPPSEPIRRLSADGELLGGGEEPELTDETLVGMYADMRLARRFDERLLSLQRQGRLGTYASLAGQEATQVGSTYALADDDWIAYQYREHLAVTARGKLAEYLLYWMGHERGNAEIADVNVFPLNISIGSHVPHMTGMGMAARYRDEETVFLTHFGDGATSEGDVHEGLNFAGVFDTPTIFCCHNNGWAISIPRDRQTASATIAQKAHAYGFDGVQVDGMDPLAVYEVTNAAVEKARDPADDEPRPTLIETLTYRYGAHTTADDPSVYRDEADVERWREKDPIDRLETFLLETGRLDTERIDALETEIEADLETAIDAAERFDGDPEAMFEYVYAEPTAELDTQREQFRELRDRHGDETLLEDDLL
ncbi:pyruvate dehydrogenase (acetyl-transferring) E1 component subunit alpha [Natrialbaceae archaeon AArc-T1-2]|uniref:pyruvate dehydrogenase (acetyl-transferring) E1 component subunit alpha n=1 Tax=Natrialbaceae archaeon AArc-T1-2 TaxID=3053904 RepID=UPI00255AED16|nr:pyruvate dehydrogenase (acetyl-transferring) E1 component subunit alpha [Natrialbaceae archaeon AArc-T1-2]WIV68133.1 pyruvate dehydrogenase (acetyl-transferring) E1 component subunit alpha [Natrialbaceae archaeon AArc-T1-2]